MCDEDGLVINAVRLSRDREAIIVSSSKSLNVFSSRTFNKICSIPKPTELGDMLSRSSLIATVDSSRSRVQLWSSFQPNSPHTIGGEIEINTRGLPILNIMFNPKRLLLLTASSLYIFEIVTLQLLAVVDRGVLDQHKYGSSLSLLTTTFCHDNGLCAIVVENGDVLVIDTYTLFKRQIFTAHTSPISALEFSLDGRFLATASTKGTLVRVFRTESSGTMDLVFILRRGRSESPITSILFDKESQFITVSGDTDTGHIFIVPKSLSTPPPSFAPVVGSAYQTLMSIFPKQYKEAVEAVRDYSHVKLRRTNRGDKFFACAIDKSTVIVLSVVAESNAFAFGYSIDATGGECRLRSEHALTYLETTEPGEPVKEASVVGTPTTVHGDEVNLQRTTVEVVLRENPPPTTLEGPKKQKKKKPKRKPNSPGTMDIGTVEIFDASD